MLACKIIATNYFNEFHDILDVVSKKMSINRDIRTIFEQEFRKKAHLKYLESLFRQVQ